MNEMPLYLCPDCSRHYVRKGQDIVPVVFDEYLSKEQATARVLRGDSVETKYSCLDCCRMASLVRPDKTNA
jgi:DNA-directed RNA polymerase subunit RPC12/RpoP